MTGKSGDLGLSETKSVLKTNPSTEAWEVELRRILNGQRESDLLRLGVEEYVDKILELSKDRSIADQSFNKALRLIVSAWRPEKLETKEYFACLITLIGAYLPDSGAPKLLYFLDQLNYLEPELISSGGYGANDDLYLNTLVALEKYFERPLFSSDPDWSVFKSYLDTLYKLKNHISYGGYIAARLIQLNELLIEDDWVGDLIKANPSALRELFSLVFASDREAWFARDIETLLKNSIAAGNAGVSAFEEVLANFGGNVIVNDSDVIVTASGNNPVVIHLPTILLHNYIEFRARRKLGLYQLRELIECAPRSVEARAEIAKKLDECVGVGENAAALFERELSEHRAEIVYLEGEFKLRVGNNSYVIKPSEKAGASYVCKFVWSTGQKTKKDLEEEVLITITKKTAAAAAGKTF